LQQDAQAFARAVNKELKGEVVIVASDLVVPRRYTSGSLAFDVMLGGGWPGNQWAEVLGKEQMGKTLVVLKTIAANQRLDKDFSVFWVAAEYYDTLQAEAMGVDNSRVHLATTRRTEVALQVLLEALSSKSYDMLVLDSWAALLPAAEEEKSMSEATMSEGARLFNRFWRNAGEAGARAFDGSERPFLGVVINQWRDTIGGFRPVRTSPGGHGKDYAYYTRVDLGRDEWITVTRPNFEKPVKVGQVIAATTIKNKAAAPQQVCKIDAYFRDAPELGHRRGQYDLGNDYVNMGILYEVIEKRGGHYYFGGEHWVGKDAVKEQIRADKGMQEALRAEVLEVIRNPHLAGTITPEQVTAAENSGRKRVRK